MTTPRVEARLWILTPGWGFSRELEGEADALAELLPGRCSHLITDIPAGSVVIPRFRALPFGRELAGDIAALGSELINSYNQHRYAADLGWWYQDFKDITFDSWPSPEAIPRDEQGPFVVKGETNSRRELWHTHCYVEDRSKLGTAIANLNRDSLISHQRIWIRRYEQLAGWGTDIVGVPIADEHRIFYFDGVEMGRGFYWVNHLDHLAEQGVIPDPQSVPQDFVEEIGRRLVGNIRWAAVDVARTADGDWRVVEINDGSQSGLSGVDPQELYGNLIAAMAGQESSEGGEVTIESSQRDQVAITVRDGDRTERFTVPNKPLIR